MVGIRLEIGIPVCVGSKQGAVLTEDARRCSILDPLDRSEVLARGVGITKEKRRPGIGRDDLGNLAMALCGKPAFGQELDSNQPDAGK